MAIIDIRNNSDSPFTSTEPFKLNEEDFQSDEPCPRCEYEEGRSEADRIEHVENCRVDSEVPKRDYRALTRKLNLVRFFAAYERMNSESDVDPSELAERERELQVTEQEWAEYRESVTFLTEAF